MKRAILSTAYFPPVQYISKIYRYDETVIEIMENFGKQSYRNRCEIMTANGILALTVPVEKANSGLPVKEMRISYSTEWRRLHLRSIRTAYAGAPYFEYYFDDIASLLEKRYEWLLDLNGDALEAVLRMLRIQDNTVKSMEYTCISSDGMDDFRNSIHPKLSHRKSDPDFTAIPYVQVFSDRMDFAPNLSILDLLFCEGIDAKRYL